MTRAEARASLHRTYAALESAQKAVEAANLSLVVVLEDLERAQAALLDTLKDA